MKVYLTHKYGARMSCTIEDTRTKDDKELKLLIGKKLGQEIRNLERDWTVTEVR